MILLSMGDSGTATIKDHGNPLIRADVSLNKVKIAMGPDSELSTSELGRLTVSGSIGVHHTRGGGASSHPGAVNAPDIYFTVRRGEPESPLIVQNHDELGELYFYGHDGSDYEPAASIRALVDGTPGSGDMPGRIELATTKDGEDFPTDRLVVKSTGQVLIASGSPSLSEAYKAPATAPDETSYTDTIFFVSGTAGSRGSSTVRGTSLFAGDLVTSGSLVMSSISALNGNLPITASIVDIGFDPDDTGTSGGSTLRLSSHDASINDGDKIGTIEFVGTRESDGSEIQRTATQIIAKSDGTWSSGAGDAPGKIEFYTMPDGAGSILTKRLEIGEDGSVKITPQDGSFLSVDDSGIDGESILTGDGELRAEKYTRTLPIPFQR